MAVKRDFTGGVRAWASGNGGHWNSNTRPLGACSRATSGGGGSWKGVLAVGSGDLILVAGGGSNRSAGEALLAQFVSRRGRNEQVNGREREENFLLNFFNLFVQFFFDFFLLKVLCFLIFFQKIFCSPIFFFDFPS